jgi:hypothetical protein
MTAHPSPGEVMMLLTDKLLRTAVLDADPGDALPEALRRRLRFVLTLRRRPPLDRRGRRGCGYSPARFRDAFDDENVGSHKAQNRCRAEPSSRCW